MIMIIVAAIFIIISAILLVRNVHQTRAVVRMLLELSDKNTVLEKFDKRIIGLTRRAAEAFYEIQKLEGLNVTYVERIKSLEDEIGTYRVALSALKYSKSQTKEHHGKRKHHSKA